ncbi:peroxisome biogenesis factor 10-like isoform X1 [Chlorella sorokiniana]|uniref:RING-type E3 ubiquitin transferase n=1 Tax=Chlorella sorokiniana TaxID=3076 RepID=A0A2P6TBC1_CHLSO|nr:peroxisome biogenesis factor 10-like isoform X1 [Chlorella sorokiniana]|eukprot:PRW05841.1 peroxisome biogenesis factor 10-like isoform X1 [Chlorella sorokiniana]
MQQGVLNHGVEVAEYLREIGCNQALLARLLRRCIPLFCQEVDKRAGPLVGQLLGLGLTGAEAARCFERCPMTGAVSHGFGPTILALEDLLEAGSVTGLDGRRLLADLLIGQPTAAALLTLRPDELRQRADGLLDLGLSMAELVAAVHKDALLLTVDPEELHEQAAVLHEELGADRDVFASMLLLEPSAVVEGCAHDLQKRVTRLVEELGQQGALETVMDMPTLLTVAWIGSRDPTAMSLSAEGQEDLFPAASGPELIRAHQKDELYQQQLTDACHDAVRRVLGPRAALRWAAETRLLSELLYLSLTTGAGRQTLGEEYCDILQVAGAAGAPPGTARRGLLVLLQALGPYLADRLAAPAEEDDGLAAWRQAQAAAAAGRQQDSAPPSPLQRLAAGVQRLREAVAAAAAPAAAHLPAAGAFLRDYGPTLLRIHLVLFYLYGCYYQPAKRAAGVRYLFLGRALEGRPSYRALGVLLLGQLGISGLLWLLRRHGSLPALLAGARGGAAAAEAYGWPGRGAALLGEDGKPLREGSAAEASSVPAAATAAAVGDVPGTRRCPLCLSVRACPTATPCGHVFCWQCICDWASQRADKPECPLCRAEFAPCQLTVVRHADF